MTGCPSCRYQGAEPFAAQANTGARRWPEGGDSGRLTLGNDERPATGIADRSEPLPIALPTERA